MTDMAGRKSLRSSAPEIAPQDPANDTEDPTIQSLYRQHNKALVATMRREFGAGPPEPEDLVQQAFQKLMERPSVADISDVRSFLWRTARNLMLNEKRAQAVKVRRLPEVTELYGQEGSVVSTPESVFNARQQLEIINDVIATMPKKRQRIYMLHIVDGMTVTAIAKTFRMSRAGISKQLAKAIAQIEAACS